MPIISSMGSLERYQSKPAVAGYPAFADTGRSTALDAASFETYAQIYRTQPAVRTVVDFLAENISQVPVHAYRRNSDTDRERLASHDLIGWLTNPNPGTTRARLFGAMVRDFCIFHAAYWLKVRGNDRIGLVRLPPQEVNVNGWLIPRSFTWTLPDGRELELPRSEVVYFAGYDPCDPLHGVSPLETLRQLLAEDNAQTDFRRAYWENSSRLEGVIERPKDAPKWTPDQKQAWREQWQTRYRAQPGQTAVLEDGMTFKATSYSARESEFTSARKLTDEEVTRAYHVPLPLVGILEHATFSNIREQRKQLYQDTLGTWFEFIVQELERQLLPECRDTENVYLEFNIADKLKGAFEEMADSLFKLTMRPILTANEARARLNLPSIKDDPTADALALPLNTSTGAAAVALEEPPPALPPPGNDEEEDADAA